MTDDELMGRIIHVILRVASLSGRSHDFAHERMRRDEGNTA
jgi:hypothetical protein